MPIILQTFQRCQTHSVLRSPALLCPKWQFLMGLLIQFDTQFQHGSCSFLLKRSNCDREGGRYSTGA